MTRRTTILAALGAAVLLGLGTAIGLLIATGGDDNTGSKEVNRASPKAVATAFIKRYATGDPSACALVTAEVAAEMREDGRCQGQVRGRTLPSITYLRTAICPPASTTSSMFYARVQPPGQIGKPYIMLGLSNSGTTWSVSHIWTRTGPSTQETYSCAPPEQEYGS